jgi:cysteine desulfurase
LRTPVYLDHHATTPVDPSVIEVMNRVLQDHFGNPGSAHAFGWAAAALVDEARGHVAELLGCESREIVFTSGATESNNLALKGLAATRGRPGRIVTSNLEHDAVMRPAADLERQGWEIVEVACGRDGVLNPADLSAALTADTTLVSIVAAQNEIGTLQRWAEIGALCAECGVPFHTDAAQAVGRVPLNVAADHVDLLSLSAHKFYGPKGIGALYVRAGRRGVRLQGLVTGGGQEKDLRSGTLNVPGIVGLGEACRLALARRDADAARLRELAAGLLGRIVADLPDVRLNGHARRRLPGSLNLTFTGVDAAGLLRELPALALSTGSACSAGDGKPSRVLRSLGLSAQEASASLRICLGRNNTAEEADFAAERIVAAVRKVREEREAG